MAPRSYAESMITHPAHLSSARALLLLALTALALNPVNGRAQEIWAKVVDASNGRPIRDAEVQLLYGWGEVVRAAVSDHNGRVYLKVGVPGGYRLAVDRLGYPASDTLAVHLEPGQTLTVQLALEPKAIELEGLTVVAEPIKWGLEMAGFYDRQRTSMGHFREIGRREELSAVNASDYFRTIPGVLMKGGVPLISRAQSLRFWGAQGGGGEMTDPMANLGSGATDCYGLLVVDGLVSGSTAELNSLVTSRDISAIEVHANSGAIPPQWRVDLGDRGSFACGVFVVWTKRGDRIAR